VIDYIAMDIKAPLEKYEAVAGAKVNIENINESINILKNCEIDHEFRTTVVPDLLGPDDLIKIAEMLRPAKKYVLQQFLPKTCLDKSFEEKRPYSEDKLKEFQKILRPYFEICELRL
jgi:pyruvate formate lyase activating enzyme